MLCVQFVVRLVVFLQSHGPDVDRVLLFRTFKVLFVQLCQFEDVTFKVELGVINVLVAKGGIVVEFHHDTG